MKPENIIKFSEWSNKPDGTLFKRVVLMHNKREYPKYGRVIEWDSYDVTMLVIKDGDFHKVEWDYLKGRVTTHAIMFTTSEIDFICEEFEETDLSGILDAFAKFFYDSREARLTSEEEIKKSDQEWREDNIQNLKFILRQK